MRRLILNGLEEVTLITGTDTVVSGRETEMLVWWWDSNMDRKYKLNGGTVHTSCLDIEGRRRKSDRTKSGIQYFICNPIQYSDSTH